MSLDPKFSVAITRDTLLPSQAGFGTPMALAYHNFWPQVLRTFNVSTVLTELVGAGVPTSHPVYRMAQAVRSQRRKPAKIVIGKRTTPFIQVFEIRPLVSTEGHVYTFTFKDSAGLETVITRTVPAASSLAAEATAIAALIDPLVNVTAAAALGVVTVTGTSGTSFSFSGLPNPSELALTETTADPGLTADLAVILTAAQRGRKAAEFYGVACDVLGEATAKALFVWCQANSKVMIVRTTDAGVCDGAVTTDLATDVKALSYDCGFVMFAQAATADYRDLALLAVGLSYKPGTATFAYKNLIGIAADNLDSSQTTALEAKRVTYYVDELEVPHTFEGRVPNGEFLDLRIASDLLAARIQERLFGRSLQEAAIPFTQAGIDIHRGLVLDVLKENTPDGPNDPAPAILAPREVDANGTVIEEGPIVAPLSIKDTSTVDRANRELREITFSARFRGAIHKVFVEGRIGV